MIVVFKTSAEGAGIEYNATVWAPRSADMLATYLVWIMISFAYVIVSSDYVDKTVSNLVVAGGKRVNIFASKLMLLLFSSIIAVIISCFYITIFTGAVFGWGDWDAEYTKEFIKIVFRLILYVIQYVAYFSLLCSVFENQAASMISSFLVMMTLSIFVQILKIVFKSVSGIEEKAPCVTGNIIGSYGDKYITTWGILCVISFIVVGAIGIFLSKKREF